LPTEVIGMWRPRKLLKVAITHSLAEGRTT